MMLTRRDLDIINFLEDYRIATTSTIQHFFFPSLRTCQLRLKTLTDNDKIKRARLTMNHDYMYYVKKPSKVIHDLLCTEFYRELSMKSEVLQFLIDKELGKIRPDAIFVYKLNGKQNLGLLEVEISHKGFDFDKYTLFKKSGSYTEFFPIMPTVYIVGKNIKIPNNSLIKYCVIKPDMSDFKL